MTAEQNGRTSEPVLQSVLEHGEHIILGALVWDRMLVVPLTTSELEEVAARIDARIGRLQNARGFIVQRHDHINTDEWRYFSR